jgi:hypothetical protein
MSLSKFVQLELHAEFMNIRFGRQKTQLISLELLISNARNRACSIP